jgi:hypothetical protein
MGGNVDDSLARYWVLKGQLRAGSPSVPGSGLALYRLRGAGWWLPWWSGVRWGVCELDSGCEHLISSSSVSVCVSV